MSQGERITWDGHPISPEPPFGVTIVVYRVTVRGAEFLVLHRPHAPSADGDWAWTPPSGARYPDEEIGACASRELAEETGLRLEPVPVVEGKAEWHLYAALLDRPAPITLSDEHDEYRWVSLAQALDLCQPDLVAAGIRRVAAALDLG